MYAWAALLMVHALREGMRETMRDAWLALWVPQGWTEQRDVGD